MIRVEKSLLTVYNGIEDKGEYTYTDESSLLPDKGCDDKNEEGRVVKCHLIDAPNYGADNEAINPLIRHRRLVLGEPFKSDAPYFSKLFKNWDAASLERALLEGVGLFERILEGGKVTSGGDNDDEKDYYLAIVLLRAFVQLNYTGPDIQTESALETLELFETVEPSLYEFLEVDGIKLDKRVKAPGLLLTAKYLMASALSNNRSAWPFLLIWRYRIDFLHQKMLQSRSWTLSRNLKYYADEYVNWYNSHGFIELLRDVHVSFICEISEMLIYYYDGILSDTFIKLAQEMLGLTVKHEGQMGFRTQFQRTPLPQTVVTISLDRRHNQHNDPDFGKLSGVITRSESLNDDTRLERIRFVNETSFPNHGGIHQLVLLAMIIHLKGLKGLDVMKEDCEALIRAVTDHPKSWSGRISALMERCCLEQYDKRAVDRALRQLRELSKVVSGEDLEVHAYYRQYLFFGSGFPSKTSIKSLYGEILMSTEHWKEALGVFTELDEFRKIVTCLEKVTLRHKAEELIQERMSDVGETPELLVMLGDVTSNISHYEKAWDKSGSKSVDAQIALGNYYFKREEFAQAVTALEKVVALAPLEYPSWVKLAWAYYQTESYENAFRAYLYAANLEYDNFQVWNNLANCALKMNRKDYALKAYKEAIKCNYDEWKVWSNILTVASELGILTDSVHAFHRILDKKKDFSDDHALDKLVHAVVTKNRPSAIDIATLAKLFGRITSVTSLVTKRFVVWILYAQLLTAYAKCSDTDCNRETKVSNFQRALQYYEKALVMLHQAPWRADLVAAQNLCACIKDFREKRQFAASTFGESSFTDLKHFDLMLKKTARTVHEYFRNAIAGMPPHEKLKQLYFALDYEMKNPYYTT